MQIVEMEELSIQYFRDLLDKHIKELKSFCKDWEDVVSDKTVPEDVIDEVRTAIGLTNLLLCQKLKQFGELIDDSEFKRGEKEITCIDLQGFWDMVFHEVEKIRKSFKNLEKCQSNNWMFIQEPVPKIETKKKPTLANTVKVTTAAKAHAMAARQRLAEAKQRMMEAKKKMRELKSGAKEEIIIMETNSQEVLENGVLNIVPEQNVDPKKQLNPVLETVKDPQTTEDRKEHSNKTSKKSNTLKSNKKTALPQEVNGHVKKQKSENTSNEGKENLSEMGNKKELLSVTAAKVPTPRTKRGKSPKEIPPSQRVTRSASKRAMLAQQND